ncbi:MAG: prepilin-type N-terminal cleavage/methylation domain-containing protein [Phycisphaerales bacterium JB054]
MRGFTLLECVAVVMLLALASAAVAVGVSPSVHSARSDEARSIVLDADARTRVLAARGDAATLTIRGNRVLLLVGDSATPVLDRRLPAGVKLSLVSPAARTPLADVPVDRVGQSPDYILVVEASGTLSETLVAGLTGYAFAEEVSKR